MCLFDPVLAVLSSGSGRLSFRDLYADGGSGLGQVRRTIPPGYSPSPCDDAAEKRQAGCG